MPQDTPVTVDTSPVPNAGPSDRNVGLPSVRTTIWVTVFFGVFGVIPATIHANEARKQGAPGRPYWVAFGLSMIFGVIVEAIVVLAIGTATGAFDISGGNLAQGVCAGAGIALIVALIVLKVPGLATKTMLVCLVAAISIIGIILANGSGLSATASSRLWGVVAAVGGFVAVLFVIFALVDRVRGKLERPLAILICLVPAVLLATAGLIVPAIKTIQTSFTNAQASGQKLVCSATACVKAETKNVGLDNYKIAFTDPDTRATLIRTLLWIIIVPLVSVAVGLIIALLTDRMKRPNLAKTLIFLPTAISFVGASLIWALVYDAPNYKQDGSPGTQTGLLSELAIKLGWSHPPNWILHSPTNSYLLMVILIWVQAGFAMVVLGAALKAIPEEILEAARIDGATGARLFRTVQIPMIRNTLVVVVTTITIASLKIFDIVNTVTGGNYKTDILANLIYTDLFVTNVTGKGSALAVILFLCVVPLVAYNVVQIRRERATR